MLTGLACDNVTICFRQRPAVHHVSFAVPPGAFVGLIGPNGAGKSTLLHGMLGWLPLTSGKVTLAGRPLAESLQRVSFLPQKKYQDIDFPVDVETLVGMGRYQNLGLFRGFGAEDQRAVDAAIHEMGLDALRSRPLAQLSGGQQQRAFIARSLATGADVLMLDEPLTGLDAPTCRDLMVRLRSWAAKGRVVIAVIHDLAAVQASCTHAVLMNRDLIASGEVNAVMTAHNLAHTYGGPVQMERLP